MDRIRNLYIDNGKSIFWANENKTKREYENDGEHEIRSKFERDRDRIMYSKSFRRLEGKTQVFVSGYDDHVRNRLTHTLEVSQIARTIAKALNLNEYLAEAIALGHDLGHTPFGHIGERTLNYIMSNCDKIREIEVDDSNRGFKHNYQGVRVVRELENYDRKQTGLNLTKYTMWGILNHSKLEYPDCKEHNKKNCTLRYKNKGACCNNYKFSLSFYDEYKELLSNKDLTVEGLIVGLADEIAQRHHDIEDALESEILEFKGLCEKIKEIYNIDDSEYKDKFEKVESIESKDYQRTKLGSFMVDFLSTNAIKNIKKYFIKIAKNIKSSSKFEDMKSDEKFIEELKENINFDTEVRLQDKAFQKYIYSKILNSHKAQCMDGKGNFIIREVLKAYVTNPQQLEDKTIQRLFYNLRKQNVDLIDDIPKSKFSDVGLLRQALKKEHAEINVKYEGVLLRTICEHIGGMTDNYIMKLYANLYQV